MALVLPHHLDEDAVFYAANTMRLCQVVTEQRNHVPKCWRGIYYGVEA
jgi:hypothetical protein